MHHHLKKNGQIHCTIVHVSLDSIPPFPRHVWHDCNMVASQRVTAAVTDNFGIVTAQGKELPYEVLGCRIGVDGWVIEGRVFY